MRLEMTENSGIRCDNEKCDFINKDSPDENLGDWLNVPCPKCGENLLTQQDYENALKVDAIIDMINTMTEEEIADYVHSIYGDNIPTDLDNAVVDFTLDIHNGIKFTLDNITNDTTDN